jgi:hypothetical protein
MLKKFKMEEIWKDIPDYEGIYQVSNLGNVKSLPKEWISAKGVVVRKHNGIVLKKHKNRSGYYAISFTINKKPKTHLIHQLVAITFLNHKPNGHTLVIDHINDDKLDNRVENLQIVTHRFNTKKTQGKYSSIYKGVSINISKYKLKSGDIKIYKYYLAVIKINKRTKYLGRYKDEYKAHLAYQNALKQVQNERLD